jgi:hypothetical protein
MMHGTTNVKFIVKEVPSLGHACVCVCVCVCVCEWVWGVLIQDTYVNVPQERVMVYINIILCYTLSY